ncbi:TRAFAC clade GTPase domain-containing protein [Streptomyces chartreusis]|uniref:TRAFAC clade GTPase domain-containing protein n=1 Tax=Streptomyces chartreusis TaxID=1969 RepID=UPI00365DE9F6
MSTVTPTLVLFVLLGSILLLAVGLCFFRVLWQFLGIGVRAVWRGLGPWQTGQHDQRVTPVKAGEPAQLAYWWRQMRVDSVSAAAYGMRVVWTTLSDPWLERFARNLFHGRRPSGIRGSSPGSRFLLVVYVGPGVALGAILGASLVTVVLAVVHAVFALLLGLVWLGCATAVPVLRGVERGWLLVRGVRVKCPYPGCYRPVPLAVYRCPNCRAEHRALQPGRYGVLWHACACGHRLPTTRLAGRGKLAALCPHCARSLPETAGTTRVVHAPLVGGTSSGKTMLMAAMVEGLHAWARRGDLSVGYASDEDRRTAADLSQELKHTGWAHATTGGQPRALMLTVTCGRRRRLLYLYDPMGESVSDAERVRAQQYLAHADGIVLVADVLADPKVRGRLSADDAGRAGSARPSAQGPWETYQRLIGELTALSGRRGRLSVATVVTKRDVLDQLTSLPVAGARIDSWLEEIGLGGLVRALGHDFRSARYWAVSAHAATGTGPLEPEQRRAAEPVLWLLAASGLRTGTLIGPGAGSGGKERRLRLRGSGEKERKYSPA